MVMFKKQNKIAKQQFVDKAREYLGVLVVHAGRNKLGIDCVGLFVCTGRDLGMLDKDYTDVDYSPYVVPERLIESIEKFGKKKAEFETFDLADIVVFTVGKWPHHIGLISKLDDNGDVYFIHTDLTAQKVVESRLDRSWSDRIHSLYSIKGLS